MPLAPGARRTASRRVRGADAAGALDSRVAPVEIAGVATPPSSDPPAPDRPPPAPTPSIPHGAGRAVAARAGAPGADRPLGGQVALVTGAGRGIGRAIAERLAADGAAVALVARSAPELDALAAALAATGARALALPADVTDPAAVAAAVDAAERALGPLDLCVANAGAWMAPGPLWEADPAEWWRVLAVNVRGAFLTLHAALARMVPRGRGRVVAVASRTGTIPVPHASAYATSKAALLRLVETAALEAGPHGVTVLAVDPGTVRTAMTDGLRADPGTARWLPWYDALFARGDDAPADAAARLVARIAAGSADPLAGRLLHHADDLDALVADAAAVAAGARRVLRLTP